MLADRRKHFRSLTDRVRYVGPVVRGQVWTQTGEVGNRPRIIVRRKSGGFSQHERSVEQTRSESKDSVTVLACHRHDEIRIGRNTRGELSSGKPSRVTPKRFQHPSGLLMNRVTDDGMNACANALKIRNSQLVPVG